MKEVQQPRLFSLVTTKIFLFFGFFPRDLTWSSAEKCPNYDEAWWQFLTIFLTLPLTAVIQWIKCSLQNYPFWIFNSNCIKSPHVLRWNDILGLFLWILWTDLLITDRFSSTKVKFLPFFQKTMALARFLVTAGLIGS